jgi:hypothetical protein
MAENAKSLGTVLKRGITNGSNLCLPQRAEHRGFAGVSDEHFKQEMSAEVPLNAEGGRNNG